MDIVALCGSLRAASLNLALLRTAADLAPAGMRIEIVPLHDLPMFNEELEPDVPAPVAALRARVVRADAVLLGCPEYNSGPSGALKNAIDWLSRGYPGQPNPLAVKPVAAMGASPSQTGTVRAQVMLRQMLTGLGARVLPPPEVFVNHAGGKVADGRVADSAAREAVAKLLANLAAWIDLHRRA
jgi:chromate reductase